MAGTEIANEEIAFGNSVKTSGNFILYRTPALEGASGLAEGRIYAFRTVAPYPEKRGGQG